MGLISAIAGAAGGVLADSWRDFFYEDSMDNELPVFRRSTMKVPTL